MTGVFVPHRSLGRTAQPIFDAKILGNSPKSNRKKCTLVYIFVIFWIASTLVVSICTVRYNFGIIRM